MNYARNTITQEVVFFETETPPRIQPAKLEDWAFWAMPTEYTPHKFAGKLIGEDPERRCERMRHAPKHRQCRTCQQRDFEATQKKSS